MDSWVRSGPGRRVIWSWSQHRGPSLPNAHDLTICRGVLDRARSVFTGAARIVYISIFRVCGRLRRRSAAQSALTGRYPWAFSEFCPHSRQMIVWFRASSARIYRFVLPARIPTEISARSENDNRLCPASNSSCQPTCCFESMTSPVGGGSLACGKTSTDRTLRVYVVPRVPGFTSKSVSGRGIGAGNWSRHGGLHQYQ